MIEIRESNDGDIESIADFQLRLAHETESVELDRDVVVKGIQAMFDDPAKGKYFIAEYNGQPAGCHSITYEWSDWRNGVVWWLQSVYVVPSYRKFGIFRAMFENLREMIELDSSVRGLRLYVDNTNARAQEVYKTLGMNGDHYSVFELMKE